jgi:hypothetical protein
MITGLAEILLFGSSVFMGSECLFVSHCVVMVTAVSSVSSSFAEAVTSLSSVGKYFPTSSSLLSLIQSTTQLGVTVLIFPSDFAAALYLS